jgi:hypothetical protein
LLTVMLALLHRLFQLLLVIRKQSMNLLMSVVADSVNLRSKILPRRGRILIEERLNPVMVLLKQRTDLPLLFRSQCQIFREAGQLLVDRLRCMDMLKLLTRRGLRCLIVLSCGRSGHSEQEPNPISDREKSLSHGK